MTALTLGLCLLSFSLGALGFGIVASWLERREDERRNSEINWPLPLPTAPFVEKGKV